MKHGTTDVPRRNIFGATLSGRSVLGILGVIVCFAGQIMAQVTAYTPAMRSFVAANGRQGGESDQRSVGLDVRSFGAACNWNGTAGSDDTRAFNAAGQAATARFIATGSPVLVRIPFGCEVAGTVTYGSGVHWEGPGSVIIPMQNTYGFLALSADDVSVEDLSIHVLHNHCGNNVVCSAVAWESAPGDATSHHNVRFLRNTITGSNWGILALYTNGTGSLSDVQISDNSVSSDVTYTQADGIHVGGAIRNFTLSDNRVSNRGDAAIAATSEGVSYPCSGGVIVGNTLLEDYVGIDDSGCSNLSITGNYVSAMTAAKGSNPAFRSIYYGAHVPRNVLVSGNFFGNAPGSSEYAAKVDDAGYNATVTDVVFSGNLLGSLYVRASGVTVSGNTFPDGAKLTLDGDGPNGIPTTSVLIGVNSWIGSGSLSAAPANLVHNCWLSPQLSGGQMRYTNRESFSTPTF